MRGVSKCKADFLDVTTSQGFRYADWFYMGVGIGADVLFSSPDDNWGSGWNDGSSPDLSHSSTTTAVMLPLFTDFRFTFGGVNTLDKGVTRSSVGFFIDLRRGCSFLCSDDWIRINNGYLTNQQYFYLRPSVGLRIFFADILQHSFVIFRIRIRIIRKKFIVYIVTFPFCDHSSCDQIHL